MVICVPGSPMDWADDAGRFARVDAGSVEGNDGLVDDFLGLRLGQLLLATAVASHRQVSKNSVGERPEPVALTASSNFW